MEGNYEHKILPDEFSEVLSIYVDENGRGAAVPQSYKILSKITQIFVKFLNLEFNVKINSYLKVIVKSFPDMHLSFNISKNTSLFLSLACLDGPS